MTDDGQAREGRRLALPRVRSRVSAYVYGNVLALGAVLQSGPGDVEDGVAVLVVVATTLTTYLAHVVAHQVGEGIGRDREDHRTHVRTELRDAVPIVSSGTAPAVVLLVGWLWPGTGPETVVQLVAALVVVVRLGFLGALGSRFQEGASPRRTLLAGFALATTATVIALAKVLLTH